MTVVDAVERLVAPILDDLGLELYDVEFGGGKLAVTIHRAGGVDLDTIALVTRLLLKNPTERPQSAEEVIHLIDSASNGTLRTGEEMAGRGTGPVVKSEPTTLSGAANTKSSSGVPTPRRISGLQPATLSTSRLGWSRRLGQARSFSARTRTVSSARWWSPRPSSRSTRKGRASGWRLGC